MTRTRGLLGPSLLLPFQAGVRGTVAVLTLVAFTASFLMARLGLAGSLIGLVLAVLAWIMLFRVASEILLAASEGSERAPAFRDIQSPDRLAVRHIGLWILASLVLVVAAGSGSRLVLTAFTLAVGLALPAATILLTLTGQFEEALNPVQWMRLAARIGPDHYALAAGALIAFGGGYILVDHLLSAAFSSEALHGAGRFAYWCWAVFAWFFLAGRLVHLHRNELNLETEPEPEDTRPRHRAATADDPVALWAEIRSRGGTREMHAALARALDRSDDAETRLAHGRLHVAALLLAYGDERAALDRTGTLQARHPEFTLAEPGDTHELINAACRHGHTGLAVGLCAAFLEAFPKSVRADEIRLAGAEAGAALRPPPEPCRAWYRRSMVAPLDHGQRERLEKIRPIYASAGDG